jgi:site-specific DNA recombinase
MRPENRPGRAVVYLRVSTGRQAEGEVSLPSQRDLTRRFCAARGWEVVEEYVEPGASATDDRRPVFQRMLEDAAERRFEVICVHAFSRFYRNGAEMELTIRRLRRLGVEVVSVTQPTGDDPSQEMMRQIIGIFDEYTSRENGKNVTRAMRESARQGFWNGASPPLGYRVVEAERRGAKIKKRLDVDPVEAELVRLIYRLYADGVEGSRPLGVKDTTKWLNAHGYRTRRGSSFGVGSVHAILTNACYASGKWPYGVRNAREGTRHDPSTIIHIPVPPIVPVALFERVAAKLADNNPHVTPPRVVNGPTLLAGLAVCARCGGSLTRSGTRRRGRVYSYYSCASHQRRGRTACTGGHLRTERLDGLVMEGVRERLLVPERLAAILEALVERRAARDSEVEGRRAALRKEAEAAEEKIVRLYKAIEDGVVDLDEVLGERIRSLKAQRDVARAAIERIARSHQDAGAITGERLEAFAATMRERLETGDVQARKAWLRAVVARVEVGPGRVRIIGEKASLAQVIAGQQASPQPRVSGFVRKWRARRDSNSRPSAPEADALSN